MGEPTESTRPYRIVDRYQRGWLTCNDVASTYPSLDDGREWTFETIIAERGPARDVVPPTDDETDRLQRALTAAGTKAAATVLVALYTMARACYNADGHDQRLVAGRPGSWESVLLPRLAWEVGSTLGPRRADEAALAVVEDVIRGWIFSTDRYVEVAENLADVFGRVVNERGGWVYTADRWIRHGAYEEEIRGYLTTKSVSHYPGATNP